MIFVWGCFLFGKETAEGGIAVDIVTMKLSELKVPERNVRMHPEQQIKEFIRSIKMFGQTRPIVVDENNMILIGNGLYKALEKIGAKTADVLVRKDLSEQEKKKLMIADNKIYSLGVDDLDAINDFIKELLDYDVPGYDEDLLEMMMADADEVTEKIAEYGVLEQDEVADIQSRPQSPQIQPGTRLQNPEINNTSEEGSTGQNDTGPQGGQEDGRPFVSCPKCGEKIWL